MASSRLIGGLCFFLLFVAGAHADVNKCISAQGKVEYRDGPCDASGKSTNLVKSRTAARDKAKFEYENDSDMRAPTLSDITPAPAAPAPAADPGYARRSVAPKRATVSDGAEPVFIRR